MPAQDQAVPAAAHLRAPEFKDALVHVTHKKHVATGGRHAAHELILGAIRVLHLVDEHMRVRL